MKLTLRIEKLSVEIEGEELATPEGPLAEFQDGTYTINGGKTFPIPKNVLKWARLWNEGLTGSEMAARLKNVNQYDVVTKVSAFRSAFPELFPYRGAVKQQLDRIAAKKKGKR